MLGRRVFRAIGISEPHPRTSAPTHEPLPPLALQDLEGDLPPTFTPNNSTLVTANVSIAAAPEVDASCPALPPDLLNPLRFQAQLERESPGFRIGRCVGAPCPEDGACLPGVCIWGWGSLGGWYWMIWQ
eukprot:40493-Chlamydomonas_euryale.AAC.3